MGRGPSAERLRRWRRGLGAGKADSKTTTAKVKDRNGKGIDSGRLRSCLAGGIAPTYVAARHKWSTRPLRSNLCRLLV